MYIYTYEKFTYYKTFMMMYQALKYLDIETTLNIRHMSFLRGSFSKACKHILKTSFKRRLSFNPQTLLQSLSAMMAFTVAFPHQNPLRPYQSQSDFHEDLKLQPFKVTFPHLHQLFRVLISMNVLCLVIQQHYSLLFPLNEPQLTFLHREIKNL
jgi:hypothetical protein